MTPQKRNMRRVFSYGAAVLLLAAVGTYLTLASRAAVPAASVEPEGGNISGNAAMLNDTSASGGKSAAIWQ